MIPAIAAIDIIPLIKPGNVVCEIGCRKGASTRAFALAGARVCSIDPWKEYEGYKIPEDKNNYAIAVNNLSPFGGRVTLLMMMSSEALPYIPMCDLVWIDGNHEYEYICHDIKEYWKKVKIGGYLTGHDYTWPSVAKAVCECTIKNDLIFHTTGVSWIIKKNKTHPKTLIF